MNKIGQVEMAVTEQRQDATTKILIGPILFLYSKESLVSSSLNSNLHRFHCAHPKYHKNTNEKVQQNEIEGASSSLWNPSTFKFC